ncbi:MAG TPA: poly-beta-1,6-N-acetyl-D-glucosamine synthase [Burkholderiaceae bacterium]|nr:poly-beta-1,6-N-acetyl-D-glucosamine synthase [Burkholderiaceae bacterium]
MMSVIAHYVFLYPLVTSFVWIVGALIFRRHYERGLDARAQRQIDDDPPKVAIIVPCYNEEADVLETVGNLLAQDYPNFEVICVNDGSRDRTGEILDALARQHARVRVIHQATNQGKAAAMHIAALMTRAELLFCIDGDCLPNPDCTRLMVQQFLRSPRLGAVTGNPRIRTRSTLLGRIQVGEFSATIGLLKRAQRAYGRLFTASGVCTMFRRTALHEVGYWAKDMQTEDVDISWRLQLAHWDVQFQPAAVCWILMPETLRGLWAQRLRWAVGGTEVVLRSAGMWKRWKQRRMWPLFIEFAMSTFWAYAMLFILVFQIAQVAFADDPVASLPQLWGWTGLVLAAACLLQITVSVAIDLRYDQRLGRNLAWVVWYPAVYWTLHMMTTIVAVPKVLLGGRRKRAMWKSPDRGVRQAIDTATGAVTGSPVAAGQPARAGGAAA